MKYLKDANRMHKYNLKTLLEFEFLFKISTSLIFLPLAVFGFNITMKVSGYNYLTLENIFLFLSSPLTIFLLILVLIYLMIVTMFDITTIIIILDESYQGKKINLKDAIKLSSKKCLNYLKPNNVSLIFLVLFLMPFLNLGISTNVISSIKIPEFILDYIKSNTIFFSIYIIIFLILITFVLNLIYSFHYMVLENLSFRQSRKKSIELSKVNGIKDKIYLYLIQCAIFLFYILIICIGIGLIIVCTKYLNNKVIESINEYGYLLL